MFPSLPRPLALFFYLCFLALLHIFQDSVLFVIDLSCLVCRNFGVGCADLHTLSGWEIWLPNDGERITPLTRLNRHDGWSCVRRTCVSAASQTFPVVCQNSRPSTQTHHALILICCVPLIEQWGFRHMSRAGIASNQTFKMLRWYNWVSALVHVCLEGL